MTLRTSTSSPEMLEARSMSPTRSARRRPRAWAICTRREKSSASAYLAFRYAAEAERAATWDHPLLKYFRRLTAGDSALALLLIQAAIFGQSLAVLLPDPKAWPRPGRPRAGRIRASGRGPPQSPEG
jgi:hypothetical protein